MRWKIVLQIDDLPFLFCVIMVITSVVSGDGSNAKELGIELKS